MLRVLVVTAVPAEADAVLAGLGSSEPSEPSKPSEPRKPGEASKPSKPGEPGEPSKPGEASEPSEPGEASKPSKPGEPGAVGPYPGRRAKTGAGEVVVLAGGVGPARAAACAGTALALERPDLVLSAGVAGGFAGRAAVGDVVVAAAVVHADLGADSPTGFLSLADLGLGEVVTPLPEPLVALAAARTGGVVGPVLTVSTVTGTASRAVELTGRHRPVAEAMEGAGVLAAALAHGVPFGEIRAVSNPVGRRDRATWDLPRAFAALAGAFGRLLAEPLW